MKTSVSRLLLASVSIVMLFSVLLISGSCSCGNEFQVLDPTSYLSEDRDEAWRNDLQYLEDSLRAGATDLFYEMSEQDFENAISTLYDDIPSLTDNEISIELAKIVTMIGDGHMQLHLINLMLAPIDASHPYSGYFRYPDSAFRTYPIRAYWFSDGLFVVGSTEEHTETLGTEITQIGNKTPEQIEALVRPIIFHDTEEGFAKTSPYYVTSPEILHTLGVIDDMESALFTFQNSDESTFQLSLSPYSYSSTAQADLLTASDLAPLTYTQNLLWETALNDIQESSLPLYLSDPATSYWYEYLEADKTVYLQFNEVLEITEGDSFETFFSGVLSFIDDNDVDKLVIDLRLNPGGNFKILESSFKNLGSHSFNTEGQIYTIIGRETGSAAIVGSQFLKENTDSLFYGEGVYDTRDMYWNNQKIPLPNSQLSFVVGYGPLVLPGQTGQFTPDVEIKLSSADYLSGGDPILEQILSN